MWQSIQKCRIQKIFRGGYSLGRLSMKEQPGWLESIFETGGDRVGSPYEHRKRPPGVCGTNPARRSSMMLYSFALSPFCKQPVTVFVCSLSRIFCDFSCAVATRTK